MKKKLLLGGVVAAVLVCAWVITLRPPSGPAPGPAPGPVHETVAIRGSLPSGHTKVVAFYPDGEYTIVPFTGGEFSIDVRRDSPVILIFLEDNDEYLGYLYLENGIESLPTTRTREGVSVIDLQHLIIDNSLLSPSHNPIGDEIELSPEERALVAQLDDFFSSIARNPDVDGDRIPDLMEEERYMLQVLYYVSGGTFVDLTPATTTPPCINGYKLALTVWGKNPPDAVVFTGPEGSGLNTSSVDVKSLEGNATVYFTPFIYNPTIHGPSGPPAGVYRISCGSKELSFDIPDQAPSRIVLPVPTVSLNPDGTVAEISWRYLTGDGFEVNPQGIFSEIEVQIEGTGYSQGYASGWLPATTLRHALTRGVRWSEVARVNMVYNDIYGNQYVVIFEHPRPAPW